MRSARRKINFQVYSKHVWVDMQGKYGADIRGSTHSSRRIRIKHHTKNFVFGGCKYKSDSFKFRGLPANWLQIAMKSDFKPIERRHAVWDIFDCEVGSRHHNFHSNKRRAWLTCYREALERASYHY